MAKHKEHKSASMPKGERPEGYKERDKHSSGHGSGRVEGGKHCSGSMGAHKKPPKDKLAI